MDRLEQVTVCGSRRVRHGPHLLLQTKQRRHCAFTRMLCCPLRSPANLPTGYPGGMRKSSAFVTAWISSGGGRQ